MIPKWHCILNIIGGMVNWLRKLIFTVIKLKFKFKPNLGLILFFLNN